MFTPLTSWGGADKEGRCFPPINGTPTSFLHKCTGFFYSRDNFQTTEMMMKKEIRKAAEIKSNISFPQQLHTEATETCFAVEEKKKKKVHAE